MKIKDMIGLPVIEIEHGKKIGSVKDIFFNNKWVLQGILLDTRHWFSSPRIVPWDELVSAGPDAVMIPSSDNVYTLQEDASRMRLAADGGSLIGLPVMTTNGRNLGKVDDVYLEENMGKQIKGFELTDGLFTDLQEGRKKIPCYENITFGEDAIIVPVNAEQDINETFY